MKENFTDTAEQILRFKTHSDSLVRKMVITLIPTLASYDTQTFSEHFLHKAMGHLLTQLDKPNERSYGKELMSYACPSELTCASFYCYWTYCCRRW
jgi:hypothetical protein